YNAASVNAALSIGICYARPITDQAARSGKFPEMIDGRQAGFCGQRNHVVAALVEKGISSYQYGAHFLSDEGKEGRVQLGVVAGLRHEKLLVDCARSVSDLLQLAGGRWEARIDQRADQRNTWHQLVQQANSLGLH